jgi:phosphoglycolate phosphatase
VSDIRRRESPLATRSSKATAGIGTRGEPTTSGLVCKGRKPHYSADVHRARSRSGARRLVVFDFDGTLADTWRDIAAALDRTLLEAGLPRAGGEDVRFGIGEGVLPLLRRVVPSLEHDAERLADLYRRFGQHYLRGCLETTGPYPGIPECLDALREHALVVASNKPVRFLERVIEGLGWKRHFRCVLGGDSLAVRKPDRGVIEHVVRVLGESPPEVWMVGDSAIDVATGRAAGARTIGCAWGLRGRRELREAGVEFLVEHPREIPPLVAADR